MKQPKPIIIPISVTKGVATQTPQLLDERDLASGVKRDKQIYITCRVWMQDPRYWKNSPVALDMNIC